MYKLTFHIDEGNTHKVREYKSESRFAIFDMACALDAGTACMEVLGNPAPATSVGDVRVYKLIDGDFVELSRHTWNDREYIPIPIQKQDKFYLVSWEDMTTTLKHRQRSFKEYTDATMFANGLLLVKQHPELWKNLVKRQPELWKKMDAEFGTVISYPTVCAVCDGIVERVPDDGWQLKGPSSELASVVQPKEKEQTND